MSEELFVKETPETLEICGIRYTKDLFRAWGEKGIDKGTLFKLVERENGCISIQTLRDLESELSALKKEYDNLLVILAVARDEYGKSETELMQELSASRKCVEALRDYVIHDSSCILSQQCAGEPTADGGYRMKYGEKWYQTKPIDETPKCQCGLDETLSAYDRAMGETPDLLKRDDE